MISERFGTLKLKTAPSTEPLSLTEVIQHLRLTSPDENEQALLTRLIKSARQHAESYLSRALITQTWTLYLEEFDWYIYLFKCPVQSITSIKYYDLNNEIQTLDTAYYDPDLYTEPCRVESSYGYIYPLTYDKNNAVQIEFVAGYGTADYVPDEIKTGMLLYITYLYEHRGDESIRPPRAIYDLFNSYRIQTL